MHKISVGLQIKSTCKLAPLCHLLQGCGPHAPQSSTGSYTSPSKCVVLGTYLTLIISVMLLCRQIMKMAAQQIFVDSAFPDKSPTCISAVSGSQNRWDRWGASVLSQAQGSLLTRWGGDFLPWAERQGAWGLPSLGGTFQRHFFLAPLTGQLQASRTAENLRLRAVVRPTTII